MQEEKDTDVQIVNDEPELNSQDSGIVVDLDPKPVQKQADQPKETKSESKPSPDITKLHNTIAYQNRKLEQAMKKLEETQAQISALRDQRTVTKVSESQDEIDEIANRDWKAGVRKVVSPEIEKAITEAFQKRETAQAELNRKVAAESELDKSKKRVMDRYPSIELEDSEESTLYRQVLSEDNSLLSNIHGPEIAMYRMEERMRSMGKTPPSIQPLVDKEVQRQARAGVSSVVGRPSSPNGKIMLTKDQKQFCDKYKIPYAQYAKNLKSGDFREGVEV